MKPVDLRSDTVTLPTQAMREAMYGAELGDDVFGEDPTMNRLQEMAAEWLGKEASLFVASGTMGNLIALLTHCGRGDGAIMGDLSHTCRSEQGGSAALGGIYIRAIPNQPDGTMDPAQIEAAIPSENIHHPRAKVICLENTHNSCGGIPLDADYTSIVADIAHRHGLALHLDGARIFNAAIALGIDARELAADADSVMFCLSKGLSAPVGSMLCGSTEFIKRAVRSRKVVGGGMRQTGVLAAPGIVALEQMVDRLQEDHENGRILAEGIADIPGLSINPKQVRTNLVWFDFVAHHMTAQQFVEALRAEGVWILAAGPSRMRAATHYGISRADIEQALRVMRQVMSG
jgi:threonine aldolase